MTFGNTFSIISLISGRVKNFTDEKECEEEDLHSDSAGNKLCPPNGGYRSYDYSRTMIIIGILTTTIKHVNLRFLFSKLLV